MEKEFLLTEILVTSEEIKPKLDEQRVMRILLYHFTMHFHRDVKEIFVIFIFKNIVNNRDKFEKANIKNTNLFYL